MTVKIISQILGLEIILDYTLKTLMQQQKMIAPIKIVYNLN